MTAPLPDWHIHLPSCSSTNTWALDHLDQLAAHTVVTTSEQTAGRGQYGRPWISDPGVLTMSYVSAPYPVAAGGLIAVAAGLALVHAISDLCPQLDQPLLLKWPNDVVVQHRKLAGLLCESKSIHGQQHAIIGIGCNCCPHWGQQAPATSYSHHNAPISLADLIDQPPQPDDLVAGIRRYLHEAIALICDNRFAALRQSWEQRHYLAGRTARIHYQGSEHQATIGSLDVHGQLICTLANGASHALSRSADLLSYDSSPDCTTRA